MNSNRVLGWGLCKSYLIGFNFGVVSLSSSMFFIVVTTIRCSYLIMFLYLYFKDDKRCFPCSAATNG